MTKTQCINDSLPVRTSASRHSPSSLTQLTGLIGRFLATVGVWYERSRQRRALQGLDDYLLKDIGISRADVYREATKPFWRN
ncbi:MAG: DUF1127 domain-containing protein [Gammaproteobacteria bacterium]|nr:DUF1127 domain-containing protein [Gammaproteobacteria bacterium]MCP5423641.1 DUF1127 domain-containing protein [Gammaproteobacteria bacterium]MCP5459894.1 DUF1127 domain-containing protein [Gammaproteobacteria bacterium]